MVKVHYEKRGAVSCESTAENAENEHTAIEAQNDVTLSVSRVYRTNSFNGFAYATTTTLARLSDLAAQLLTKSWV